VRDLNQLLISSTVRIYFYRYMIVNLVRLNGLANDWQQQHINLELCWMYFLLHLDISTDAEPNFCYCIMIVDIIQ
jgi:hypothetical protein